MIIPDEAAVGYAVNTHYDVRYWFYTVANALLTDPHQELSEDETLIQAKDTLLRTYRLYQYAKDNGYEVADSYYEDITTERIADARQQDNYKAAEQV